MLSAFCEWLAACVRNELFVTTTRVYTTVNSAVRFTTTTSAKVEVLGNSRILPPCESRKMSCVVPQNGPV